MGQDVRPGQSVRLPMYPTQNSSGAVTTPGFGPTCAATSSFHDSVTFGLVGPVKLLMFGLVHGGGRGGVSAGVL